MFFYKKFFFKYMLLILKYIYKQYVIQFFILKLLLNNINGIEYVNTYFFVQ